MKPGDKFIMRKEIFPDAVFAGILVFDFDDGSAFLPYRLSLGGSVSNCVWLSFDEMKLLIPYDGLSDKEKFLYELSGITPDRLKK